MNNLSETIETTTKICKIEVWNIEDVIDLHPYYRNRDVLSREQKTIKHAKENNLPIYIHGKAYKPNVAYCIGSYSTLIGHYLNGMGVDVQYVDPLADDRTDCVDSVDEPAVILMAHNRQITYGYTGAAAQDQDYFKFRPGSIIVDPFRQSADRAGMKVIHYGNTRSH
jgi:hypothetical protein